MSCCGVPPTLDEMDEIARLVSGKLAAFLKTLREASFTVGMQEGQDAAALLAAGYGRKPGLLRSAFKHLFSARKVEWDKFDGLFDAFWLRQRVRSRVATAGTPANSNSPSVKSLQNATERQGSGEAFDQIPSGDEAGDRERSGEGRAEGASRAESLAETDFRKLSDPAEIEEAHALAARLAQAHARAADCGAIDRAPPAAIGGLTCAARSIAASAMAACRSALVRRRRQEKPAAARACCSTRRGR
jgi:uncharacterized protein with von Willebrand factor type A (vWA) domain